MSCLSWFQQCVVSLSAVFFEAGEKGLKLVQERSVKEGGGIVALFVVSDVLNALPHTAWVVFPEVGLSLHFVFHFSRFDASVQDCSGLPVGLPLTHPMC